MAQDIRDLFKNDEALNEQMPKNHQERFLEKLNKTLPEKKPSRFNWMLVAASIVLLLGFGFSVYKYFNSNNEATIEVVDNNNNQLETKTLGDVSPGLKKVEDYYLASIHLELSKIKYTPETKELFDGYILQLETLDKEYKQLSEELTQSGPTDLTINALIDNLKFRLNLLYRLRGQLKQLNQEDNLGTKDNQII